MYNLKGQKKVLTPEEKYRIELQTETQLLRFQRQYHILECDRKVQKGGVGKKQRKVINILKREYNEILTDLGVAASDTNAKNDQKVAMHLQRLLQEHNHFKCEIKREKAYLNELDMQITYAKRSIVELRSKTLTEIQCTAKIMEEQRILEQLENKLDTATKRFCTTIASNHKLREEIDHLLIERANFNKSWDGLCRNLKHGKKFMLDLIEQATIAYDQREEWCQKLQALRTKAYNEFLNHSTGMTEMQRQIDCGDTLQEFLFTKGQKRIMRNLLLKEFKRREQQRKEMQELLENYTNIIENIREFMGENNVKRLAEIFCYNEFTNFSKFQYTVELNQELENTSDDLLSLHLRIDHQNHLNDTRNKGQIVKLEALQHELDRSTLEADEAEHRYKHVESTLNELIQGIDGLFAHCRCSDTPLLELLGDNSTINIHNVLLYLKILENRVNEMIVTVYYKDVKKQKRCELIHAEKVSKHIITITNLVTKDPCPLCVEQTLVSDVIDSLQYVMEKDLIAVKLEEAIEKRGFGEVVHNVSGCHLPKSRAIIQRRFQ